jgi:hypothetical protein
MHRTDHSHFRKPHDFVPDFSHAERRTRIVIGVTAAMMIVEIAVGLMSNSMALLADGWHMSTHVLAFLITAIAYYFARTQAGYARYFTPPPLEGVPQSTIAKFAGTTNESAITKDAPVTSERAHYFDAGVTQKIAEGFNVGIDGFYKSAHSVLDEGQFGEASFFRRSITSAARFTVGS